MTVEMVKMDHNDARDGQKKIIMMSEMIKKPQYDVRDGQNGFL